MTSRPLVTFVAVAYMEPRHNRPFIDSMLNQIDGNWQAIVYHNGPNDKLREHIAGYNDSRLIYMESETNEGNWGTGNRQRAIDICDTSYIVQSSIQDYWLPQAVEYINETIQNNDPQIIVWNSINHLVGPCVKLDGQLAWSKCDWGQFALKTWIARKVGIKRGDVYCGDWAFVEDVLKSGYISKQPIKLPKILTIHN